MPIEMNVDFSLVERYFHVSPQGMEHPVLHIPGQQLVHGETVLDVLRQGQALLRGKGLDLSASFVGATLFNLVATSQLFLAQYNQWLAFDLNSIAFEVEDYGNYVLSGFKIVNLQWKEAPLEDRDLFIEREMRALCTNLIIPVITVIAEQAKVNPAMIWNQFGAKMTFVRDDVMENEPRPQVREQFIADYEVLTKQLTPDVFGRKVNPFYHEPCYIPSPYQEGKQILMRSSCCFYYRRENGQKCITCPLLKDSQREQMHQEIVQARAAAATAG